MLGRYPWGRKKWGGKKTLAIVAMLIIITLVVVPIGTQLIANSKHKENLDKIMADSIEINVYNHISKELMVIPLEEYIVGVVAAEMPADFEIEALKAQALAARTYIARRIQIKDNQITKLHPKAQITTNPSINQAWISIEQMKKNWGNIGFTNKYRKIVQAVAETKGEVILFDKKFIDPLYFSSTGGKKTENSEDVFVNKIPYLRSVKSFEEINKHQESPTPLEFSLLGIKLGLNSSAITATKLENNNYLKILERTTSGRVKTIKIGEKTFSGREVREKLGLKSTDFSWEIKDQCIIFTTNGYGHAVGMSQYGANYLAKQGKSFEEIIKHYYTGVEIGRLTPKG